MIKKLNSGFTLIELLVVIAIIGVLATTVLASLNLARQKARNARRISDLRQISLALELYYDTNNGYPLSSGTWSWRSQCPAWGGFTPDQVIPGLTPTYMSVFPADPSMNVAANTSCYLYLSNGADYALLDHNGPDITYTSQPSLEDPARDSGANPCIIDGATFWAWKVSSTGGRCW